MLCVYYTHLTASVSLSCFCLDDVPLVILLFFFVIRLLPHEMRRGLVVGWWLLVRGECEWMVVTHTRTWLFLGLSCVSLVCRDKTGNSPCALFHGNVGVISWLTAVRELRVSLLKTSCCQKTRRKKRNVKI